MSPHFKDIVAAPVTLDYKIEQFSTLVCDLHLGLRLLKVRLHGRQLLRLFFENTFAAQTR